MQWGGVGATSSVRSISCFHTHTNGKSYYVWWFKSLIRSSWNTNSKYERQSEAVTKCFKTAWSHMGVFYRITAWSHMEVFYRITAWREGGRPKQVNADAPFCLPTIESMSLTTGKRMWPWMALVPQWWPVSVPCCPRGHPLSPAHLYLAATQDTSVQTLMTAFCTSSYFHHVSAGYINL